MGSYRPYSKGSGKCAQPIACREIPKTFDSEGVFPEHGMRAGYRMAAFDARSRVPRQSAGDIRQDICNLIAQPRTRGVPIKSSEPIHRHIHLWGFDRRHENIDIQSIGKQTREMDRNAADHVARLDCQRYRLKVGHGDHDAAR